MAKYLLLKHYRGAPQGVNDVPMDRWSQDEITAHIRYMDDFADRLREWSDRGAIELHVHDYFTDDELYDYEAANDKFTL